jgi:uncharacterized membrane protein YkvA (DUF1232 family)
MNDLQEYEASYSDDRFWDKLKRFAKAAGKEVVEKALLLYYSLQEESVPKWAKTTIIAALGYFILPLDAIPDLTPVAGYGDDLGVLTMALAAVAFYLNDDIRAKARAKMDTWFGETTTVE